MSRNKLVSHQNGRGQVGKCFPMTSRQVTCGNCGTITTRKKTKAIEVKEQKQFIREVKPIGEPAYKRYAHIVASVKRVCAEGCVKKAQ